MIHGCGSIILGILVIVAAVFGVFALLFYVFAWPLWVSIVVTFVLAGVCFFLLMGDG